MDARTLEDGVHKALITDISLNEMIALAPVFGFHIGQVGLVASVGEIVQNEDYGIWMAAQQMADEVGTNKTATPGNENAHFLMVNVNG